MQELIELQIEELRPSPTNPRDPNEEPDSELTQSIRDNGVIQPLIVRPQSDNGDIFYEIAAGHRRRINAQAAGLANVPCIVRDLTDDQMIDFHVQENIHRKDLGPMEEARTYKLIKDRGNTHAEIALRAAKSESYVARFLKLNDLIPELQTDVAAGVLPLTHAFVLCKYSADTQEATTRELYDGEWVIPDFEYEVDEDNGLVYDKEGNQIEDTKKVDQIFEQYSNLEQVWTVDKTRLQYTANRLEKYLVNQFTLQLDKAIFDLKDKRLRPDKLICGACPERTGANATLFDLADDAPDFCLNRKCFEAKTQTFIEIVRRDVAKKTEVAIEQVPVVVDAWSVSGAPEGWVGRQGVDFLAFESDEEDFEPDEHCEFERTAIFNGKPITICHVSSGCQIHHWQNRPESRVFSNVNLTDEERSEKEQAAKQARKEELWNVKVAEETRQRVVIEAAKKFAEGIELNFDTRLIEIRDVMIYTAARLWQMVGYNEIASLKLFTTRAGIELPDTGYEFDHEKAVLGFDNAAMRQLYFILTHFWKGAMNKSWTSQEKVVELATRHGIDYRLVDAQVRVEISAKKHEKRHKAYLQQIEVNDPDAQIPLLYTQVEKVEEKVDIPADIIPANATETTDAVDIVEETTKEIIIDANMPDDVIIGMDPKDIERLPGVEMEMSGNLGFEEIIETPSEPDKTEAFEVAGAAMANAETAVDVAFTPELAEQAKGAFARRLQREGDLLLAEAASIAAIAVPESVSDQETPESAETPVEGQETPSSPIDVVCSECSTMPGFFCTDSEGRTITDFHDARRKLFAPIAAALAEVENDAEQLQEIADASDGRIVMAAIESFDESDVVGPRDDESEEELNDESDAFGEAPESLENSAKSLSELFDEAIGG